MAVKTPANRTAAVKTPSTKSPAANTRKGLPGKAAPPLLELDGLSISYHSRAGIVPAVRQVSLTLEKGGSLGLVGESGCGKSTLAYAVMNYLGRSGRISGGSVRFKGQTLSGMPAEALRLLRGGEMAMVYQDPNSCLNPVMTVGRQLMEAPMAHQGASAEQARERALEIMAEVALPDPAGILARYPHQLSGGQQQRVLIGMALMSNPELLVMDEPTTGLDVTIEAAILELIADLRERHGMALLFISHNLGTVNRVCERIGVMYCGELVEQGPIDEVLSNPRHPYTRGLLDCLPRLDVGRDGAALTPIPGQMPAHPELSAGCVFAPRCGAAETPRCTSAAISDEAVPGSTVFSKTVFSKTVFSKTVHQVRCIRSGELPAWKRTREGAAGPESQGETRPQIQDGTAPETQGGIAPEIQGGTAPETQGGIAPETQGGTAPEIQNESTTPLLEIVGLEKAYEAPGGLAHWWRGASPVRALNGVSLSVPRGQTLAIVGESGCGKSTLAKILSGLEGATGGSVRLNGVELAGTAVKNRPQAIKKSLQMVFQHPDGTLNPSHTVGFAIGRSLRRLDKTTRGQIGQAVSRLLHVVNLPEQFARRLPRQLSGGQKQRVAIARALAGNPELLVADEPVSALDVSVQASIINLLLEIQAEQGTTMIFISHDLAVVRYLADWVAVMYLGKIMEAGTVESMFNPPYHPYTEALLSSAPVVQSKRRRRIILEGGLPSSTDVPRGCAFHSRCPRKLGDICEHTPPPEHQLAEGHRIACHIPLDILKQIEPVFADGSD